MHRFAKLLDQLSGNDCCCKQGRFPILNSSVSQSEHERIGLLYVALCQLCLDCPYNMCSTKGTMHYKPHRQWINVMLSKWVYVEQQTTYNKYIDIRLFSVNVAPRLDLVTLSRVKYITKQVYVARVCYFIQIYCSACRQLILHYVSSKYRIPSLCYQQSCKEWRVKEEQLFIILILIVVVTNLQYSWERQLSVWECSIEAVMCNSFPGILILLIVTLFASSFWHVLCISTYPVYLFPIQDLGH